MPGAAPGDPGRLLPTGGVTWLSGLVHSLQRQHPQSVVVAAGDLVGGSPLMSSVMNHDPTVAALNRVGLEFSAVGNHEFDRGLVELRRLQREAQYTYLAANVRDSSTGKLVFPAWGRKRLHIPGRGSVDVAFIGAVLEGTPGVVNAKSIAGLSFGDEADSINAVVGEIRAAGIETIIALIHQGGFTEDARIDSQACTGFRGPILDIVDRLDPAIDLVITGHTHRAYVCTRNGRMVTSAGLEGRLVTDLDLMLDPVTHDVQSVTARQLPVVNDSLPNPMAKEIPVSPVDPDLAQQVAQWRVSVAGLAQRPLGRIVSPLTRAQNPAGETTLGDVVADAQLQATAAAGNGGAQIALVNNGSLRADLNAADGTVTYANAFAVQAFGNLLITLTLTGAQIEAVLESQWLGAGSLLQVSRGFQFSWRPSAPPGDRIAPADILLDGQPLSPTGRYRVTVTEFLAGGGDGYPALREGSERITGPSDLEAFEQYLSSRSPLSAPVPGRIVRLP